ncbi:hypothetical protein NUU61_000950 [Penicillium alfredii]|uniref:Secreted protein n=1 Tax=Penicillium alfredii TaxID=1506179 RepID=A0A9W9GAQ1_9EURO|nr:uncharacterized protein NUU61_000950 [Penicillium alfredii]KAJ5115191.1 hypothetical protein NUU61_000950 [Penicillium alfredii]
MRLSTVMVLCWTLLMGASAMQVVIPGPCNETCNGSERTFTHDVVCGDADFNNTGQGRKYRDCVMCEHQSSSYLNPYATDLYWFLSCSKSCDPLHAPLTARWIRGKHDFAKQYDYCNWNASALIGYGSGCADCLEKQDTTKVMANCMPHRTLLNIFLLS